MSPTIDIDKLRIGMFVHLDLGWWQHPFARSSFLVASADQIATIRTLGLARVRWSPDKSQLAEAAPDALAVDEAAAGNAPAAAETAITAAATAIATATANAIATAIASAAPDPAQRERDALAAQRAADALCQAQYNEAAAAWRTIAAQVAASPVHSRSACEALSRALLDKLMVDDEMCIRVLSEGMGDRAGEHALNVAVIALLMGRVFGLADAEMLDTGVGALLHDIGKLDLPERVRHAEPHLTPSELNVYRDHVARGVLQGQRMGLTPGALLVLAQHHEMADGSGFPCKLNVDRMGTAARIVALVNRYDNLCNPGNALLALTPHEALSMIFAQAKNKFDVSMLNAFIRMMGVYPPGSTVQLTDDRFATVLSVNSSRPLKPRVRVCDPSRPPEAQQVLNLEQTPSLGIRRSLRPQQLPAEALQSLVPARRMVYFFEPVAAVAAVSTQPMELAA